MRKFGYYLYKSFPLLSGASFALVTADNTWPWRIATLGAGISLGGMYTYKREKESKSLEECRIECQHHIEMNEKMAANNKALESRFRAMRSQAFETFQKVMSEYIKNKSLQLYPQPTPGDDFRITVYTHNREAGNFSQVGRYSPNMDLNCPASREYPLTGGSIGKAWSKSGEVRIEDLPDPDHYPKSYIEVLEKDWGIPVSVAENLTMKSRSMIAHRFPNQSQREMPIGVILIETTAQRLATIHEEIFSNIFSDEDGVIRTIMRNEYELYSAAM